MTTPTAADLVAFAADLARADAIADGARQQAAQWGPGPEWDQLRAHLARGYGPARGYALGLLAAMGGGERKQRRDARWITEWTDGKS